MSSPSVAASPVLTNELAEDAFLREVPEIEGYKFLPPCLLVSKLGEGGMGAVYRGWHVQFDFEVAVKCLVPALATPEGIGRFRREARLAARITHENLVAVKEVTDNHGIHYMVMEFVRGETLRERVKRRGPLSAAEAVTIMIGAARGMAAAHAESIVHRDIKPANIMISKRGNVKVADLGLGRGESSARSPHQFATIMATVMGTPSYMPPEQWYGVDQVGPEGDVWALGATLDFLLRGDNALRGSQTEIRTRVLEEEFPALERPAGDVPEALLAVIRKATQRKARERYRDARELLRALENVSTQHGLGIGVADEETGTLALSGSRRDESLARPPRTALETAIAREKTTASPESTMTMATELTSSTSAPDAPAPAPARATARMRRAVLVAIALSAVALAGFWGVGQFGASRRLSALLAEAEESHARGEHAMALASLEEFQRLAPEDDRAKPVLRAVLESRLATLDTRTQLGETYATLTRLAELGIERPERARVKDAILGELRGALEWTSPEENQVLERPAVEVKGSIKPLADKGLSVARVLAGGEPAVYVPGEPFIKTVRGLAEGENTLQLTLVHAEGVEVNAWRKVLVDTRPPELAIATPSITATGGRRFVRPDFALEGSVRDASRVVLTAGTREGASATPRVQGDTAAGASWSVEFSALPEGRQEIRITAREHGLDGSSGRQSEESLTVIVDGTPPAIEIRSQRLDLDGAGAPRVTLELAVADRAGGEPGEVARVLIAGQPAEAREGLYAATVGVDPSRSEVELLASDAAGNETRRIVPLTLAIERLEPPPDEWLVAGVFREVRGRVRAPFKVERLRIDGEAVEVDALGAWRHRFAPRADQNTLEVIAIDASGNERSVSWNLGVAPPVTPGFTPLGPNAEGTFEYRHDATGIVMVRIEGGEFTQGSGGQLDPDFGVIVDPQRRVALSPFLIAKYELSEAEYASVVGWSAERQRSVSPEPRADIPMSRLSWNDVNEFRARANLQIPTEAQWELACRAGGDVPLSERADWSEVCVCKAREEVRSNYAAPQPRGFVRPNAFGLSDMHGNVSEWCFDYFAVYPLPDDDEPLLDPEQRKQGKIDLRILRGGNFQSPREECTATYRFSQEPVTGLRHHGFRPAFFPIPE